MRDVIIEIDDLIFHHSTIKCYVVSTEEDMFGTDAERIYLPRLLVSRLSGNLDHIFRVPEWLAIEKGLV